MGPKKAIINTNVIVDTTNNNNNNNNNNNITSNKTEPIKSKRGRKSKKELMASLNMEPILSSKDTTNTNKNTNKTQSSINLSVNEIATSTILDNDEDTKYESILSDTDILATPSNNIIIIPNPNNLKEEEQKPPNKKRGRKPKGGKIIQCIVSNEPKKEDKPNIILHLKCCMKDLQTTNSNNTFVESYNFQSTKNDLTYDIISTENTNINIGNEKQSTFISNLDNDCDYDDNDDDTVCKDANKEIWKKLKQLEQQLHINNVNNKKSACFWDTCEFDNPPVYIPKHFINGTYEVYGCFCSPECGVAYLMDENIDSSTKFERYHMFNHIYTKIYDYKKNIKPAPNPYYMLEKYYGNLSVPEYRSLLQNERLFLIVDKPLTRILPELHEDNDDFILNNKIIPSNNYHVKLKLQKKKQNKTNIVNEKFGIINPTGLE